MMTSRESREYWLWLLITFASQLRFQNLMWHSLWSTIAKLDVWLPGQIPWPNFVCGVWSAHKNATYLMYMFIIFWYLLFVTLDQRRCTHVHMLTYCLVGSHKDIRGLARWDHEHSGVERLHVFSVSCHHAHCVVCNTEEKIGVDWPAHDPKQVGFPRNEFQGQAVYTAQSGREMICIRFNRSQSRIYYIPNSTYVEYMYW